MKKLLTLALTFFVLTSYAQTLDPTFQAYITERSRTESGTQGAILFPDGKYLVYGYFIRVNGQYKPGIVKFNADGSIDNTFNIGTGPEGEVLAAVVQADGKIILGGRFSSFNGVNRANLIRLNADGSVDNSFVTNIEMDNGGIDFNLVIQPNGKILFTGSITKVDGISIFNSYLIRLNTNGSYDNTFTGPAGISSIRDIGVQSDGKIIIGGFFTKGIMRLNTNGSEDATFTIGNGFDSPVFDLEVLADDKIIVGGNFTSFNNATGLYLVRLTSNGTLDLSYLANDKLNGQVSSLFVHTDGKLLVGGYFTKHGLTNVKAPLRLNADGSIDGTLNIGTGSTSLPPYVTSNSTGAILTMGDFTAFNGQARNGLAILNAAGTVQAMAVPLNLQKKSTTTTTKAQGTDKILLAHQGDELNGTPSTGFERLNLDGTIDGTFSGNSKPNDDVNAIAFDQSGNILIGGFFTTYNGITTNRIARLSANGVLDNTFTTNTGTGFNGRVQSIVELTDGKLLVGGYFTSFNGTTKKSLVRLNANGTLDATFNVANGFNTSSGTPAVFDIKVLTSGKILVAGTFDSFNGNAVKNLIRLNADGTLDNTFLVGAGVYRSGTNVVSEVLRISVTNGGNIVVGGTFDRVNNNSTSALYLAVLNSDGTLNTNIALTGFFVIDDLEKQSTGKFMVLDRTKGLSRLNQDGSIDPSFTPLKPADLAKGFAFLGSDIVFGGCFTSWQATSYTGLGKVKLPLAGPQAPTSLTTTSIQTNAISLSWTDASTVESGYSIERSLNNNLNFQVLANLGANTTTFTDSSVPANTQAFYRVRAFNAAAYSVYTNEISASSLPYPPPTELAIQSFTNTQIVLTWKDNSLNETGFEIYRSTTDNTNYSLIHTTSTNVQTYTNTGLTSNTKYYYTVKAVNSNSSSIPSNEVSQLTFPAEWSGNLTTSIPGREDGVAVSINGKGYVGLGRNSAGALKDWWEYDPTNNTWTQKADFPGTARIGAVAFIINNKAYVGTGNDFGSNGFKVDFYEYDPTNNSWTQKADFPKDFSSDAGITSGVAFAIGNYGYVGLGNTGVNNTRAFYRYDPAANTWQARSNFGGTGRTGAVGFSVNGLGYVGFGYNTFNPNYKDMWEYNPTSDLWFQKASYSGEGRGGSAVTVVNGEAYLFAGSENPTGSFGGDVRTNANTKFSLPSLVWSVATPIPASIRESAMAFTIGKKGYIYGGYHFDNGQGGNLYFSDLYSFMPFASSLPAAATNHIATPVSPTTIKCDWVDMADNETGYVLEVAINGSGSFSPLTTLPANTTTYTHTGLTVNVLHQYRVKAINVYGSSAFTTSGVVSIPLPPTAPGSLAAQATSSSSINLTWGDISFNESGFEIYRSSPDNLNYTLIHTTAANITGYTDQNLPAGTYFYKIRAINAGGASTFSNEVSKPTLPSAPSNLLVKTFTSSQIELEWTDNSVNETGFQIFRAVNDGPFTLLTTTIANSTSFTDAAVSANTLYFYQIRATNAGGFSSYSNSVNQVTLPNQPVAPTNLTLISFNATQIVIGWSDNSFYETGFEIYRSSPDNLSFVLIKTTDANVTSYTDDSLTPGIYYYKVRAINAGGNSGYSNTIQGTIPSPPNAPGGLNIVSFGTGHITIAWTDNSTDETGFEIYRSSPDNLNYSLMTTVNPNTTTYTDTGMAPDTYFYKVRAKNIGGFSAFTSEVSSLILATESFASNDFTVYPNPIKNSVTIKNESDADLKFGIYSMLGVLVAQDEINARSEKTIPSHEWTIGTYCIKILNSNASIRFIKID